MADRPTDWGRAGHPNQDHENEAVLDQVFDELTSPGWVDLSSTYVIGAVTTPPTKGNSTYSVAYRRPDGADLVHFEFYVLIGSTWSAGSGVYRFPVPFNASAGSVLRSIGAGYAFENGVANRAAALRFEAAGYFNFFWDGGTSAATHAGLSSSWTTGDILAGSIAYEPA